MEAVSFKDFFMELVNEAQRFSPQHDETKVLLALAIMHYRDTVERRASIIDVAGITTTSTDIDLVYMLTLQRSELSLQALHNFVRTNKYYLKEYAFASILRFTKKNLDVVMEPLVRAYLVYPVKRGYKTTGLSVLVQSLLFDPIFTYFEPTLKHYAELFDFIFSTIKAVSENHDAVKEGTLYYVTMSTLSKVLKERGKEYNDSMHLLGSVAFDVLSKVVAPKVLREDEYVTRRFAMLI